MDKPARVRILGAGAWGLAVGHLLENKGHEVEYLHHTILAWPKLPADFLFLALPVQHIRETISKFPHPEIPVLSLSKGMEIETGLRVSGIVQDVWGDVPFGSLSGPTFAAEIVKDLPAVCVVASQSDELATQFQALLHQPTFRLYRSTDLIGVELGGSLKNIYALVGGIAKQLDLGENALAGVLTRSLAEMTRIGVSFGAQRETFAGLSGIGDLMLTAMSEQSRNHRVGRLLAQDKTLEEILPVVGGVAEGVATVKSVRFNEAIPPEHKPLATQIYRLLYEGVPIREAIRALLERDPKPE